MIIGRRSEAFIDSIANVYTGAENKALPDNDPEKLHAYKVRLIIKCCTLRRLVRMKIAVEKTTIYFYGKCILSYDLF